MLDKSGSMWPYHAQLKEFAKSLVRQFRLGPASAAIGLVEFSGTLVRQASGWSLPNPVDPTDARVLKVGGVSGLSYDADALLKVIDRMASPNGWTHTRR